MADQAVHRQRCNFSVYYERKKIPKGAIGFTLPKAEIKPIEGMKTTFDVLIEKYNVKDPIVLWIRI